MDFGQIGAVPFLLLLIQVHHAVSAPAVPDQDTWLTGFEPNLIDGQPVEPVCRIVPVTERPPTPTPVPKPTTTPPLVTVGRARPPNPAASPSVGNGWQPPIVPHNPHPGFMLVPFLVPNGRPWFVARSVPGNLNFPTGHGYPNYRVASGSLGPASRWASFLRSGLAQRMAAARAYAFTSSESSEEYRG